MRTDNYLIYFVNGDPRVFDWLGEIEWFASTICQTCGSANQFESHMNLYDGCLRENPYCVVCNSPVLGLPVDETARLIVSKNRGLKHAPTEEDYRTLTWLQSFPKSNEMGIHAKESIRVLSDFFGNENVHGGNEQ